MATGNNKTIDSAEHVTYRAWLPVEAAGSFEYCFYFSNTVDSTWEDGSTSYAGKSGGKYTIESASIADGGTEFDPNVEPDSIVWNSPPFDLSAELEPIRTEYNATVASIAADCGAQFFDAASLLADPTDASKTVYGQHPNDEGGTVLATALAEKIREMKNK